MSNHACHCDHEHHHDQQEHKHCACGHNHHEHDHCACGHDHHDHDHCACGHNHHEHDHCTCGHDHHEHEHCGCGHDHSEPSGCGCGCGCGHDHDHEPDSKEGFVLLAGAGLFAAGLLAQLVKLPWLSPAVLVAAYLVLGLPILLSAGKNLFRGRILDENFLMSIATLGAFCIGEFPEAVGVMLFYRVGEYFEHKASARSRKSILDALDLRPETVTLEDGTILPAEAARVGQRLLLRPGDRIPLDGLVLEGESRLDTAPITGESLPVAVSPGSHVLSGCVNTSGRLILEVEKPLQESTVTRILESVEHAAASKPKMDRFITRFSRIYTPLVVSLAALTALVPSLITGNWGYWVYTALSFLVMSCPCALVISVPLAFFSGIGAAGRKGILFKGGVTLEALSQVRVAALDKTGTLTEGKFRVLEATSDEVLRLCAICEQHSTHPIGRSIREAVPGDLPLCEQMEEQPGLGIRAVLDGKTYLCGSAALLEQNGIQVPALSGTQVYLAADGALLGHVAVGDAMKAETPAAVKTLQKIGLATAMVTGDNETAAREVAKQAGVDRVYAQLLPQQKLETVEALRKEFGPVLFVGDGINDAPVLSGADVGAAMGSGADAALEAADVVFMTSRSDAIPEAIDLARKTRSIAWQNVVFAIGIKAAVMLLGLLGFANMWLAVFADSGVAMLCVLNSIRLLAKKN